MAEFTMKQCYDNNDLCLPRNHKYRNFWKSRTNRREIHPEPIAETTSIEHFETVLFHVCFPQQFVLCIAVIGVNDIKFCILIWIIVIFPFKKPSLAPDCLENVSKISFKAFRVHFNLVPIYLHLFHTIPT